jgi:hypothetical protein
MEQTGERNMATFGDKGGGVEGKTVATTGDEG